MLENHKRYVAEGHESWRMWGRGRDPENEYEFKFGTDLGVKVDVLQTRLFGKPGFHSKAATKKLLAKLDEIKPDLVHLHNIHGYYVNIEMLFEWLAKSDCKVEWTLHDCWSFTGHCAHFTYVKCAQWKTHCAQHSPCPQLDTYPKTYSKASCRWSFDQKKHLFTMLPADRMKLIAPSKWLADLARESFLAKYPVRVRYNTIDTNVFKPTPSDFRERYGLEDKFVILGVASTWSERKGLDDFIRLATELDDRFAVVLVGLTKKQIEQMPRNITALGRTDSATELAEIYSAADVHVQPSEEETFGMTVAEAQACGTPVIARKDSACEESGANGELYPVADFSDVKATVLKLEGGRL